MTYIRNIAIVGVTGNVGSYITKALLDKHRFTITAISRHGSRAEFPSDVKVRRVDYDDEKSIEDALENQDALIITTSVFAPKDTCAKLIRAAAAAGVAWILPNEFGMSNTDEATNDTIGPGKKDDRDLIEYLGVSSWIGISCGFWYEHSLSNGELYGIDTKKREVTFFDDGTQRLNTSTWPQVGRTVAALLSLPGDADGQQSDAVTLNAYRNHIVYVSSFTVNQREMFDSVKRITGTSDEQWKISRVPAKERFEEARERMKKGDRRAFARTLYTRYFFEDAGLFEKLHGLDNEKLGLPSENLDEYTEKAIQLERDGYWAKYGL
ncbi:hypothetical protein N0V95_005332 [Ascochyta clinopodiicola]|nr:hypothetical protein N0V95_005332 [Ascochyta clinopodiicola]